MNLLNSALDLEKIRKEYAANGRVVIRDVFSEEIANELLTGLKEQANWGLFALTKDGEVLIDHTELSDPNSPRVQEMTGMIRQGVLAYYFFTANSAKDEIPIVKQTFDFMTGSTMLDFIRNCTGEDGIAEMEGVPTWLRRGCYLSSHEDQAGGVEKVERRRAAFVLGLAKDWELDWGGALHMADKQNKTIEDIYMPTFNTLTLFKVPTWHFVSPVALYARRPRISISGWYMLPENN